MEYCRSGGASVGQVDSEKCGAQLKPQAYRHRSADAVRPMGGGMKTLVSGEQRVSAPFSRGLSSEGRRKEEQQPDMADRSGPAFLTRSKSGGSSSLRSGAAESSEQYWRDSCLQKAGVAGRWRKRCGSHVSEASNRGACVYPDCEVRDETVDGDLPLRRGVGGAGQPQRRHLLRHESLSGPADALSGSQCPRAYLSMGQARVAWKASRERSH